MTIGEAKRIPIPFFLSSALSLSPSRERPGETWYLSPLHKERTPSFKVDLQKNVWYDHGIGEGGTIIDLVMKLKNVSAKEALKEIEDVAGGSPSFSFLPAPVVSTPSSSFPGHSGFEIASVKSLQNPVLIDYLTRSRGISIEVAKKFVVEVYFRREGSQKNLFAVGFKNDKGGYETRNALYKGNIGGKAVTTLKGEGATGKMAVFEGFMDFLSMLTYFNMEKLTDDVIVLNSLSLLPSTLPILKEHEEVKLFLDRDDAGREAVTEIGRVHAGAKDYSGLYKGFKDANEWLVWKGNNK